MPKPLIQYRPCRSRATGYGLHACLGLFGWAPQDTLGAHCGPAPGAEPGVRCKGLGYTPDDGLAARRERNVSRFLGGFWLIMCCALAGMCIHIACSGTSSRAGAKKLPLHEGGARILLRARRQRLQRLKALGRQGSKGNGMPRHRRPKHKRPGKGRLQKGGLQKERPRGRGLKHHLSGPL